MDPHSGTPATPAGDPADTRASIRDFLATRRARLTPQDVGLPAGGGRRRVAGLRREEVAVLAGVSTEWYTRLEKGHIKGVSDEVLDAVARALRLDDAERAYLFDLARAARPRSRAAGAGRARRRTRVPERVQWMMDSMTGSAAVAVNGRLDIIATNTLGRALHSPLFARGEATPNIIRYQFLDPTARELYPDWEDSTDVTVALLRTQAGRDPDSKELRALVGELSTLSGEFRTKWAAHNVRIHLAGTKQLHHPEVGTLDLTYHTVGLAAHGEEMLGLTIYTPEPGSDSADRLQLLASLTATAEALTAEHEPHH